LSNRTRRKFSEKNVWGRKGEKRKKRLAIKKGEGGRHPGAGKEIAERGDDVSKGLFGGAEKRGKGGEPGKECRGASHNVTAAQ